MNISQQIYKKLYPNVGFGFAAKLIRIAHELDKKNAGLEYNQHVLDRFMSEYKIAQQKGLIKL